MDRERFLRLLGEWDAGVVAASSVYGGWGVEGRRQASSVLHAPAPGSVRRP